MVYFCPCISQKLHLLHSISSSDFFKDLTPAVGASQSWSSSFCYLRGLLPKRANMVHYLLSLRRELPWPTSASSCWQYTYSLHLFCISYFLKVTAIRFSSSQFHWISMVKVTNHLPQGPSERPILSINFILSFISLCIHAQEMT